jgi:hypothetical protein
MKQKLCTKVINTKEQLIYNLYQNLETQKVINHKERIK